VLLVLRHLHCCWCCYYRWIERIKIVQAALVNESGQIFQTHPIFAAAVVML